MTQLYEIKVNLSDNQKKNLSRAYHNRETIVLRLTKGSLSGNDVLFVPQNTVKRLEKNRKLNKGMDVKLAKTNIRKQVGGSLLTSILALGRTFAPTVAKTLGLSALSGLASEGASQLVKKMTGKGTKTGGFVVPFNKIDQLIPYKHLLTNRQKKDILNAIPVGGSVQIKPTKKQQTGGSLGTLLASIGVPLAIEVVRKITGKGAPQMGAPRHRAPRSTPSNYDKGGKGVPILERPPPFFGNWPKDTIGMGKKKKTNKKKGREGVTIRKKQPIQPYSTSRSNTLKLKFHKNLPLSNHDVIKWCKYLNIPIKDVLSRDESVPHNHQQALFIYNLEPAYMSGSHWVATFVKGNVINHFDSVGMPPFQEIVGHAIRKKMTLIHQNNQIQNMVTTTCGCFCLYFLDRQNKGSSYYDLLKVFDVHDTMKNEKFIEQYFRNI